MLRHLIKHKNWDNETTETVLWFNLDESTIADLEFGSGGAKLSDRLKQLSQAESKDGFWEMVKSIVMAAYGFRDGDLFWQNEEVRARWRASSSFNPFMTWLCASEENFFNWFRAVLPAGAFEEALVKVDTTDWNLPNGYQPATTNPYPPVMSDPNVLMRPGAVPPAFQNPANRAPVGPTYT